MILLVNRWKQLESFSYTERHHFVLEKAWECDKFMQKLLTRPLSVELLQVELRHELRITHSVNTVLYPWYRE